MRISKLFILLLVILLSTKIHAEEGEFAFGIAAISPNGVSAKYWLTDSTALDFFADWSTNSEKLLFHSDYLVHDFEKIQLEGEVIAFYYGLGARVKYKSGKDTQVGARLPFGFTYFIYDMPIDLFGEIAPRINALPSTNFGLDLMIGIRYRFF